ncbi:MAG: hypothetical protein QXU58_03060 [Pyrobaculum sp.]
MIVLIFHGSRDEEHNRQAIELARRLGYGYAFMEIEPRFKEGFGIPMFITDGADYRKAIEVATVKSPPLIRWPGFINYLKSLQADLYIFHGPDYGGEIEKTGLPFALLEGEPNIDYVDCVEKAAPVVLTRGYIYKKIAEKLRRCETQLLPPLVEQEGFVTYLRETLPVVLKSSGAAGI